MSAALSAAAFLDRYQQIKPRLAAHEAQRAKAAALLQENGLPGPRDEAWKYTRLRDIAKVTAWHDMQAGVALPVIPDFGQPVSRLVFSGGRLVQDFSHLGADINIGKNTDGPRDSTHRIAALNQMLCDAFWRVTLAPQQDHGTLLVLYQGPAAGQDPCSTHSHWQMVLSAGAKVRLIEVFVGEGRYLNTPQLQLRVGNGAQVDHVRLNCESADAFHLGQVEAALGRDAHYKVWAFNGGARLARLDAQIDLQETEARAEFYGVQRLDGARHGDFTSVIRHLAPQTASRQSVKNVVDDQARAVFQGKIEVARVAQKTDGYQMNQTLLLSDQAEIDSKPELEIFADDVKCSHGATVGALDQDQIFYLRSRGINDAEARHILIEAFLHETLETIGDDRLRAWLGDVLAAGKLP